MTKLRVLSAIARKNVPVVMAAAAVLLVAGAASAQNTCNPPCGVGQVCVQSQCMIPAPPPSATTNSPPASMAPAPYPAPPAPYQQSNPNGYPPSPASAYPPPPGYPQQPPQQGYPPPPAANYYPPQQGGYPPPGYAPPPPPPPQGPSQRRGFLALPFLGIHSFQGKTGESLNPGLRLGVLLGGHLNEQVSINGELVIDALNFDKMPGADVSAADVVIALSPLFHLPFGNADLAVGPKLGLRAMATTIDSAAGKATATATGSVLGINAGLFAAVSNSMSIGGLLSAEVRTTHKACFTAPGGSETCSSADAMTGAADKVIGLTAAALF